MNNDPEFEWVRQVSDELARAQARHFATNFILMELVRTIAKTQSDPKAFLAGMFENISQRIDIQFSLDDPRIHGAEVRDTVERFFVNAGKGIV